MLCQSHGKLPESRIGGLPVLYTIPYCIISEYSILYSLHFAMFIPLVLLHVACACVSSEVAPEACTLPAMPVLTCFPQATLGVEALFGFSGGSNTILLVTSCYPGRRSQVGDPLTLLRGKRVVPL